LFSISTHIYLNSPGSRYFPDHFNFFFFSHALISTARTW
jgi:hypothetical protein